MTQLFPKRCIASILLAATILICVATRGVCAQENTFVLHNVPFTPEPTAATPITFEGLTLGDSFDTVIRQLHVLDADLVIKVEKSHFSLDVGGRMMTSAEYVSSISALTHFGEGAEPPIVNMVHVAFGLPTTGGGVVAFSVVRAFNRDNQIDGGKLRRDVLAKYGAASHGFDIDPHGKGDGAGNNPGDLDLQWALGRSSTLPCRQWNECVPSNHALVLDRLWGIDQDAARGVVVFLRVLATSLKSDHSKVAGLSEYAQDVATEARSLHEAVRQATEAAKASDGR